ncbi:DUF5691 domain-containing protein [Frankia sp. Cas3]|uniref:DUF5691 domain-containing protein n=1 Tax=Frankia sp. Cas3 TaxID=3073926 RepID=UPI002AD32950|nr:DUF5691 domain-containing protein [Frankia sp. Cas3]
MSNARMPAVSRETALAVAPDAASAKAAEKLAVPGLWPMTGGDDDALWGECTGSGKTPYRVVVARADHATTCSCPSRKFPCKHAIGLLLLAAAASGLPFGSGTDADGEPPAWATAWLNRRAARTTAAASRATQATAAPAPERAAAAARREATREARVDAGVAELRRWLADLAAGGLGAAQLKPAAWWEATAARMVDAQAPGLADVIRAMAEIATTAAGPPDWPSRLTDRLGLLHLLCEGWTRRVELPADLVAVLRDRVGFTVPTAAVLAGERVVGGVDVLGARTFMAGKVQGRRQWLRLVDSARSAVVLDFAVAGQSMLPALPAGSRVHAELAPYPGRLPVRMVIAATAGAHEAEGLAPTGTASYASTWREALADLASTLAGDPFVDVVVVTVRDVTVLPPIDADLETMRGGGWLLRDRVGEALPLAADATPEWGWQMLAVGGGRGLDVVAEWDSFALTPLTATPSRDLERPAGITAPGGEPAIDPSAGNAIPVPTPRCPVPTPGWADLVDAAVVGADRRPPPTIPCLPDPADRPAIDGLNESDGLGGSEAARRLLRLAALAAVTRRAGQLPGDAAAVAAPPAAPVDEPPPCPRAAALTLTTELSAADTAALEEWLDLLAEGGWRPPDSLLCPLINLGRRSVAIRGRLGRILGPRGRWFAALHPDGGWAAITNPAGWSTATAPARRSLINALRQRDPAVAVGLLRDATGSAPSPADQPFAPFRTASGAERLGFIEALRVGLGPWDEELLEAALDDRRADVRAAAVGVLLMLPDTRFEARAAARTAETIVVSRRKLRIRPPTLCTQEMTRDGISITDGQARQPRDSISDVYARLLASELNRVDPRLWTERTGLSPERFLSAKVVWEPTATPASISIPECLIQPVIRHRNAEWALALIPRVGPNHQAMLIDCLAEPDRTRALNVALNVMPNVAPKSVWSRSGRPDRAGDPRRERSMTILAAVSGRWSAEFTRAAGSTLAALFSEPIDDPGAGARAQARERALLTGVAHRLHPDVGLPDLDPATIRTEMFADHQRLVATISDRRTRRDTLLSRSGHPS